MPVQWNAAMDQKLLLAVLSVVRPDAGAVARKWSEIYAVDNGGNNPTQRAIVEHIAKLKKDLGVSGGSMSASRSSPTKKPKSPQFPEEAEGDDNGSTKSSSPTKRGRAELTDDEETEDEPAPTKVKADDEFSGPVCCQIAGDPIPTRELPPRRARLERKPLIDPESTEESEIDEEETATEVDEPSTPASSAPEQNSPKLAAEQLMGETQASEAVSSDAPETVSNDTMVA